jgi:cystathionine beta-lyase
MSHLFKQTLSRKGTSSVKWEKYAGKDILPMWVADMEFPIAQEIQDALAQRMTHPLHGYTKGSEKTASTVCDMLMDKYGWAVQPEWLVWLPGVVPGLWNSCEAFANRGDDIIFNTPIYHHFFHVPPNTGKNAVPVSLQQLPSGRWTYDFEALKGAITEKSSMMLLCSPHNPTGTLFSTSEVREMAQLCMDEDLVIISDEIHCGLILDENEKFVPMAMAQPECCDRLVTLMSPSKTFNLAGLNCSFAVISNPTLRKQFKEAGKCALAEVPSLAFTALEAAYGDADQWHEQLLQQLRENYAYLQAQIPTIKGLSLSPMQATYLGWINTDDLDVENAAAWFEQHGVGLSAGEPFGMSNYVRINFACPMSMLKEAVERMRNAVESL